MSPEAQDPQPHTTTPAASYYNQPAPQSRQQGPFSKKILVSVVILIILIITGVVFALLSHKPKTPSSSRHSSFAISFQTNQTPITFGGAKVVQPCNLLAQQDLANAGYTLDNSSGTDTFSRTYFTGEGNPNLKLGKLDLNVIGGPYFNTCDYSLSDGLTVSAIVIQPSYVENDSFNAYVAKQKPTQMASIDGVSVSRFPDPVQQYTDYVLLSPDKKTGVQFYVQSNMRNQNPSILSNAQQAILKVVAKNLAAQSKQPNGLPTLTYDKQTFPASFAKACNLTNNSDFKQIYGVDAAPLVTENGGSPGTTKLNGKQATFIDNECFINSYVNEDDAILNPSPDFSIPDVQYLTVNTESYLAIQAAQAAFNTARQNAKGATAANGIGNRAFFATQGAGLESPLILQQGRFVVALSPAQLGVPSTQGAQQIMNELTPLGKKVAGELAHL